MKTFPAVIVANYFIETAIAEKRRIDLLKTVKLVYLAQGWHLGFEKKPLIREQVEAWEYGPVVRSVYDAFKEYGKRPITKPANTGISTEMKKIEALADNIVMQFLKAIWNLYREHSGLHLSKLTHEEGTPWHKTWVVGKKQDSFGVVIPEKTIQEYYAEKIREIRGSA